MAADVALNISLSYAHEITKVIVSGDGNALILSKVFRITNLGLELR